MTATHANAGIAAWRFKMLEEVRSYEQAREVFDRLYMATEPHNTTGDRVYAYAMAIGMGTRYGYKIGPKMYVCDGDGFYSVRLYDTEIVRFYPDGAFSVDNGGHNTHTTRERLDAVLPPHFSAYHHQKRLCLLGHNGRLRDLDHSKRIDAGTGEVIA